MTSSLTRPAEAARPAPRRAPVSPSGAVLVAGPLLVLASELVAPRQPGGLTGAEQAAWVTAHADRLLWSYLLGLLAAGFLAAGFTVVAARVTARGRVPARIGAALGVAGSVGLAGHMADSLRIRDLLLADPAVVDAVVRTESGIAGAATILPLILGTTLGLILVAVAAARARWTGRWVVVTAVLALVADFAPTSYNAVLFSLLATVTMAALAVGMLRRG